jgi:hypothetical protein
MPFIGNDGPVRRSRTGPGLAGLVAAASTLFDAGSASGRIVDRDARRHLTHRRRAERQSSRVKRSDPPQGLRPEPLCAISG